MARFYGSVKGDRAKNEATQQGHNSIKGHIRGWYCGVEVTARVDASGRDVLDIYVTGGSKRELPDQYIGCVMLTPNGPKLMENE